MTTADALRNLDATLNAFALAVHLGRARRTLPPVTVGTDAREIVSGALALCGTPDADRVHAERVRAIVERYGGTLEARPFELVIAFRGTRFVLP